MIKHITSAKDIDSLVTRQDEGEWVPYKTKAATAKDFFSNFMAKPNDQLVTSTNSEKILRMSTLGVSISRINYTSGGLNPPRTRRTHLHPLRHARRRLRCHDVLRSYL